MMLELMTPKSKVACSSNWASQVPHHPLFFWKLSVLWSDVIFFFKLSVCIYKYWLFVLFCFILWFWHIKQRDRPTEFVALQQGQYGAHGLRGDSEHGKALSPSQHLGNPRDRTQPLASLTNWHSVGLTEILGFYPQSRKTEKGEKR